MDAERDAIAARAMPAGGTGRWPALMTSLGLVSGEILTELEAHGATPMRRLIRELEWPAPMVLMAVGALVREGLVRATQHDLEVILEPERTWTPLTPHDPTY
ncbi:MAG: hypothetical protein HY599_06040 [Candidatus Omnitrophica bacterium]|nr:hypothetical protein [Candidatus Omnitrophota bacterium]